MGIGPSTKETTLHHFRDPLVDELCDDTDIDFVGVILAGIPQDNASKYFTGDRIGALAEAMRVKGAIERLPWSESPLWACRGLLW